MMRRKLFQSRLATEERGFSWLELAIIVPVALVIALIMTETVWFFVAKDDLNTAANEGARLAAINIGTQSQIGGTVCAGVDVEHPTASPDVIFTPEAGAGVAGDAAAITVESPIRSFTGTLTPLFRRITLSSTAEFTLDRPDEGSALWWNDGQPATYSCG